jgi:cytoplasmic iron level regulating protein YaaA (DUF328/UPF0246 family)
MDTKKKKEQFLEVLKSNGNNISKACDAIGINRGTYYFWKESDKEFAQMCADMDEVIIDLVESSLMKRIKDGDTTATIFFLKTKGKHRGYVEKTQVEGRLDTNVRISYIDANNVFASNENELEE